MIISRVVRAEFLASEDIDMKVILPSASNEVGHARQGGAKGKLFTFKDMEDGRIRLTLIPEDPHDSMFHAFVKPEWAVIFPIDGAGHTW